MVLWIRSQDKTTLIRSYEIYISEQQNTYLIRAKGTSHILGSYSTIERAVEVLDEIQNILISKYIISLDYKNALGSNFTSKQIQEVLKGTPVYQMPEK